VIQQHATASILFLEPKSTGQVLGSTQDAPDLSWIASLIRNVGSKRESLMNTSTVSRLMSREPLWCQLRGHID